MTMKHGFTVSLFAASAAAAACTGWGSTPDPAAAAASEKVASILKLPPGFTLDHVGHVVVDDRRVYASVSGTMDGVPSHALLRLAADGAMEAITAEADSVGTLSSRADPRVWVDGGTLYWMRNRDKTGACALMGYPAQSGNAPSVSVPLTTIPDCSPIGVATSSGAVFVAFADSYCGYDFTGKNNSAASTCNSTLVRVTATKASLVPFDSAMSPTLPNVILADSQWLYWFTTGAAALADGGFTIAKQLVKMRTQPEDGGVESAPVQVAVIDESDVPVAWTMRGTDIYAAMVTQRVNGPSFSVTGCRILRIPAQGGAPVPILEDKKFTCGGFAADGTRGFVQGASVQDAHWAAGGFPLSAGASLSLFPLDRDDLVLLSTAVSGARVIVSGPRYVLSFPKDVL